MFVSLKDFFLPALNFLTWIDYFTLTCTLAIKLAAEGPTYSSAGKKMKSSETKNTTNVMANLHNSMIDFVIIDV